MFLIFAKNRFSSLNVSTISLISELCYKSARKFGQRVCRRPCLFRRPCQSNCLQLYWMVVTVAPTPRGTGGTCPHLYKWLGTGGAVRRRTANKKLAELYWPSRKRSPKRLIVLLEPKSGGARPKMFLVLRDGSVPPLFLWTGAPTFKFVPAPLVVKAKYAGWTWGEKRRERRGDDKEKVHGEGMGSPRF